MKESNDIPGWMVAQALIIKAKNVLIEQAVELLYREIDEKRMGMKGAFTRMTESEGEMEHGLFLIRHLINEREQITEQFSKYIKEHKEEAATSPVEASKLRDIRKFLDAVDAITSFATTSMVFDSWFNDVSMKVTDADPIAILVKTAEGTPARKEALVFLVSSSIFKSNDLFTKEEKGLFAKASGITGKN